MRRLSVPSEIGRLAAPVARVLDGAWQRMHWWVATMALLYLFSGITIVKSDEVAVVLRCGKLTGAIPALQAHGPGLLFAFPRPMDQVVRVQIKRVREIPVKTLMSVPIDFDDDDGPPPGAGTTLNPLREGYALTGDRNIVQMEMVARYRVRDPAEWAFYGPKSEDALRVEVSAAMVRSLGEMGVDRVLSDGRKALIVKATKRAQAGLDASHSGLELSSLELTRLGPPLGLSGDFDAVQSAFIGAETAKKDAQAYAERAIPQAQTEVDSAAQDARAAGASELAAARGSSDAFLALNKEYRANTTVVRERLYRDAVETAISHAGRVRWVPPPLGGSYKGFRITLSSGGSGGTSSRSASAGESTSARAPIVYDDAP
jgi:membrane protease subunit HflK